MSERELNEDDYGDFDSTKVRHAFIRKVYCLLMIQLMFTTAVISFCVLHDPMRKYLFLRPYLLWVGIGMAIAVTIIIVCVEDARRSFPCNYICLILFTGAECLVLAMISIRYEIKEIILAGGITIVICFILTIFALQTSIDFTGCGVYLIVLTVIMLILGIGLLFFPSYTYVIIYACLGTLLFSFYLIYDTQLMLGGNHAYTISPEEYTFAALNLYIDVVNMFKYILILTGVLGDD